MITENHQIAYRNVVSKYYNFYPEEINVALKDFDTILTENGFNPDGTMHCSILSDPTAEVMTAEINLQNKESNYNNQTDEQMYFRRKLNIKLMIMTRVMEELDDQSQIKYCELIDYIKRNGLKQKTAVFVEFKSSHTGRTYVEMSVGV